MNGEDVEYHSVIKKNKMKPFAATWMDMEFITVNEISLRKTNIVWYHLYVETNKNDTDELIYKQTHRLIYRNRLTDLKIKLTVTKGETWGEVVN